MEKKRKYYTQAQNKATQKYLATNLEEVRFRVRKGEKAALVDEAKNAGYSAFSRYIIDAVNEKAGRQILTMPQERTEKKIAPPAGAATQDGESQEQSTPNDTI